MRWLLLILMLFSTNALADTHFNSRETGCVIGALNPDYLLCDDFENDADDALNCMWYTDNGGDVLGGDPDLSTQKGWWGNDNATPDPVTSGPPHVGPNKGVLGSDCAAWASVLGGDSNGFMAQHDFVGQKTVNQIYARYYVFIPTVHTFGGHKIMTFNGAGQAPGGIKWAGAKINCDSGVPLTTGQFCIFLANEDVNLKDESGNGSMTASGTWWYQEIFLKLETSVGANDGIARGWMDNCGADGSDCTGSPTLRFERTNVDFGRIDMNDDIGNFWMENWMNPQTTSSDMRWDNLIVSETGPIGFSNAAPAPEVTRSHLRRTFTGTQIYFIGLGILVGVLAGLRGLRGRRKLNAV